MNTEYLNEKLRKYITDNLEENDKDQLLYKKAVFYEDFLISKNTTTEEDESSKHIKYSKTDNRTKNNEEEINKFFINSPSNLNNYITSNKESTFQKALFKMIDDRNLIDADVYNKVHIDRKLFSKIRNYPEYHPSKETVILLGLSLELNESEIENLLNSASYSLPKNNNYDLIIRFCFINKIYDLKTVNELLNQYNEKLFNY